MSPRKGIPKLGRWPTSPAAVWKLAAAHYREWCVVNGRTINALVTRLKARDLRVLALEEDVNALGLQKVQLTDQLNKARCINVEALAMLQHWMWVTEKLDGPMNQGNIEDMLARAFTARPRTLGVLERAEEP